MYLKPSCIPAHRWQPGYIVRYIPGAQARRLQHITHSHGNVTKSLVCQEGIESKFRKLQTVAGGREEEIQPIWGVSGEASPVQGGSVPDIVFLRPHNCGKVSFRIGLGCGTISSEGKIRNSHGKEGQQGHEGNCSHSVSHQPPHRDGNCPELSVNGACKLCVFNKHPEEPAHV